VFSVSVWNERGRQLRRPIREEFMEWFNRKTSIAGAQISNWMLVLGAVVVIWLIYTYSWHGAVQNWPLRFSKPATKGQNRPVPLCLKILGRAPLEGPQEFLAREPHQLPPRLGRIALVTGHYPLNTINRVMGIILGAAIRQQSVRLSRRGGYLS